MNRKKISQTELRKFMYAQKRKAFESVKKIESPLAKYSDTGVLTCIVCETVVKSETVWNVHINSKTHKDNISRKKSITPTDPMPPPQAGPVRHIFKKPGNVVKTEVKTEVVIKTEDDEEPPGQPPAKKIKGILKNSKPLPEGFFDDIEQPKEEKMEVTNGSGPIGPEEKDEDMETESTEEPAPELPEGFFDNPVLDAKARNVEYKDPIQEEWERFQKEIKEETSLSAQIIHDDTEDSTTQRQIEEIDEQLRKLSKVVELEQKKDKFKAELLKHKEVKEENMSSDEEEDYEIEFDWRAKKFLC